jgi:hypothetical protein
MVNIQTGIITTVAGSVGLGSGGDGGLATKAQLTYPANIALDSLDNLYIADEVTPRIRKVDSVTKIISTVVGQTQPGFQGDGGPAGAALMNMAMGLCFGWQNEMYISDYNNTRIRRVDAVTNNITTFAGGGNPGDNGPSTHAVLNEPAGTFIDTQGRFFIADEGDNRVRMIDATGFITTVAGNGSSGYTGDGGKATNAQLDLPTDVKVDSGGTIYISDYLIMSSELCFSRLELSLLSSAMVLEVTAAMEVPLPAGCSPDRAVLR